MINCDWIGRQKDDNIWKHSTVLQIIIDNWEKLGFIRAIDITQYTTMVSEKVSPNLATNLPQIKCQGWNGLHGA